MREFTIVLMPYDEDARREEIAKRRRAQQLADARKALKAALDDLVTLLDPNPPPKKDGEPRKPRQTEATKKTGIPQSKISEVLKKDRLPRADTLLIMADFLDRSVDSILGRKLVLNEDQVDDFVASLSYVTGRRLLRALRAGGVGEDDTIEGAEVETKPSFRPPALLPPPAAAELSAESDKSDPKPERHTKRRRRT